MKKALIISLLALWAWLAPVSCIAAIDSSLLDNSTVQPRLPQKETIEEYKSDSDLNYAETKVSDRSWWEDFWRWFRSLFKIDLPQSSNVLEDPFFWVFVALLVAAIVYFIFKNEIINEKWIELIKIRNICNISIEEKRANKIIGSSLEASLTVKLNKERMKLVKNIDLAELCITSSVNLKETEEDQIIVETKKADGKKCPVCWKVSEKPCERHP